MQIRMLTVRSYGCAGSPDVSYQVLQFRENEDEKWQDVEEKTITAEEYIKNGGN